MSRLNVNPSILVLAPVLLLLSAALLLTGRNALAETREDTPPSITVGTTGIAAAIDEDGSDTGQINFDIGLDVPAGAGSFSLLIEAGAGPLDFTEPASCRAQTAGEIHPFAASPGDVRVAEFSYRVSHITGDWAFGFQEARGTIDTSRVANDDKTQFLSPAFLNNLTISLPGSSLGLSWKRAIGKGRGIGATATRYEHSGAFLAAESWWAFDRTVARVGVWQGKAEVTCHEHSHESGPGHGLYANIDGQITLLQWNLRAGWGRHGEVPTSFIGLAVELPLASGTLGLALGQGRIVAHEEAARERHAELYYRYNLPGGVTILPGLQLSDRRDDGSGPDLMVGFRFGIGI